MPNGLLLRVAQATCVLHRAHPQRCDNIQKLVVLRVSVNVVHRVAGGETRRTGGEARRAGSCERAVQRMRTSNAPLARGMFGMRAADCGAAGIRARPREGTRPLRSAKRWKFHVPAERPGGNGAPRGHDEHEAQGEIARGRVIGGGGPPLPPESRKRGAAGRGATSRARAAADRTAFPSKLGRGPLRRRPPFWATPRRPRHESAPSRDENPRKRFARAFSWSVPNRAGGMTAGMNGAKRFSWAFVKRSVFVSAGGRSPSGGRARERGAAELARSRDAVRAEDAHVVRVARQRFS